MAVRPGDENENNPINIDNPKAKAPQDNIYKNTASDEIQKNKQTESYEKIEPKILTPELVETGSEVMLKSNESEESEKQTEIEGELQEIDAEIAELEKKEEDSELTEEDKIKFAELKEKRRKLEHEEFIVAQKHIEMQQKQQEKPKGFFAKIVDLIKAPINYVKEVATKIGEALDKLGERNKFFKVLKVTFNVLKVFTKLVLKPAMLIRNIKEIILHPKASWAKMIEGETPAIERVSNISRDEFLAKTQSSGGVGSSAVDTADLKEALQRGGKEGATAENNIVGKEADAGKNVGERTGRDSAQMPASSDKQMANNDKSVSADKAPVRSDNIQKEVKPQIEAEKPINLAKDVKPEVSKTEPSMSQARAPQNDVKINPSLSAQNEPKVAGNEKAAGINSDLKAPPTQENGPKVRSAEGNAQTINNNDTNKVNDLQSSERQKSGSKDIEQTKNAIIDNSKVENKAVSENNLGNLKADAQRNNSQSLEKGKSENRGRDIGANF